ncbi:uncharacterized protein ARMOST_14377 [Armillaria ostoyae]|uniref:Uncharacterized protein n=1 Tax=Armillaria ostoyae TaxID=47428 RepID=A0A284RQG0_ARMOS|nr:uncharacterized protein ARMOST_14377 [Armillaria ostoyae]
MWYVNEKTMNCFHSRNVKAFCQFQSRVVTTISAGSLGLMSVVRKAGMYYVLVFSSGRVRSSIVFWASVATWSRIP